MESRGNRQPGGGQKMETTKLRPLTERVESGTDEKLTKGTIFDILSNDRRRHVLHHLRQQERPVEMRELSRKVAAWENEVSAEQISFDQRKRVYTALQQAHLPKMDDADIVDYDSRQGVVELSRNAEDLDVYLDVVPRKEIPWSEYYLGLGVISCVLIAATWLGAPPFGTLSGLFWAFVIAAAVTASGVVHVHRSRKMQLGSDGPPPELDEY